MSDFQFNCPSCKSAVVVDEQFAGSKIKCPVCSHDAIIPSAPGKGKQLGVAAQGQKAPPPPIPMAAQAMLQQKQQRMPGWAKALITAGVLGTIAAVLIFTPAIDKVKALIGKGEDTAAAQAPLPLPGGGQPQGQGGAQHPPPAPAPAPAPEGPAVKAEYTLDLTLAQIPGAKVSGTVENDPFQLDSALISGDVLMLRQGKGTFPDKEVLIYLRAGANLEGKKWEITAEQTSGVPQVVKKWKPDPRYAARSKSYAKGYLMKLELGQAKEGRIPGKIFLAFPDESQSFVAGTFDAFSPQAAAAATAQQANQPQAVEQPQTRQFDQKMKDRYRLK